MPKIGEYSLSVTQDNQVEFTGLVAGYHTLGVRACQGFSEISGYLKHVSGGTGGNLIVEQSHDWFNFDQVDTYAVAATGILPFSIKIIARFCRVRYQATGGPQTIRFGGLLKVGSSP